jgi:hypothetical protein
MDLAFCFYGSRFCFRTNFLFAVKNDQNYDESGNPWYSTWVSELPEAFRNIFVVLNDHTKYN